MASEIFHATYRILAWVKFQINLAITFFTIFKLPKF